MTANIETEFCVPFVIGKGRPRFSTINGHTRAYTPRPTANAQVDVMRAYQAASERAHGQVVKAPKGVPVAIEVTTRRVMPKSRPALTFSEPDVYGGAGSPDLDNVIKLVLDGLNGIAFADDAQITHIDARRENRTRGIEQDETRITIRWPRPQENLRLFMEGGDEHE